MEDKKLNPIEAIANELPNGFHDSVLYQFSVNLEKHEAVFVLGADVSNSEANEMKIIYKRCKLSLSGLAFFIAETPEKISESNEGFSCDVGVLEGKKLLSIYRGKLPENVFANWFFLDETNSFIYVAAREAKFEWLDK